MATCWQHARSSAQRFGGVPADYYELHLWFDQSKASIADFRHRAMRHHAQGIFWLEEKFGPTITNSDGVLIETRLIGEQHVREDLGRIPTIQDWLVQLSPTSWMMRGYPLNNISEKELQKHVEPSCKENTSPVTAE